jgi:hypothetical protein
MLATIRATFGTENRRLELFGSLPLPVYIDFLECFGEL